MPPAFLLFLCPILSEIDPQVIVLLVIGGISLLVKLFEKKKEEGTENTDSTTEAERRLKEKLESMAAKPRSQPLPTPTPKQRVAQQPRPRPVQQQRQDYAPRGELKQTSTTPQATAAPWATKPQQPNSATTADPFNFSINNATTSAQDSMTSLNQAEIAALERIKHAKTASAPARGHAALLAANPSTHLTALHSPLSLRHAIITAEILGKPRGLQAL